MKPTAYSSPRISAMMISPSATSTGPRAVWSIASYRRAKRSLKKTFHVESKMAPFIAELASKAGAI